MVEEGATLRGTDVEAQPVAQRDENGGPGHEIPKRRSAGGA